VASFHLHGFGLKEAFLLRKAGDVREAFVYRHARNISQLGQDVLLLESDGQSDSCPIIVRAMLEGLFKMVAATKVAEASVGIVLSEIDEEILRIKQWIKVVGGDVADLNDTIHQLTSFAQNLRAQHGVQSTKDWNAFECVKAADLGIIYRQHYFLFSKHTHATSSGIIAQEHEVMRSIVLEVVVFVVLCALGHLVQVIETRTPQQHVDKAAKLLATATDLSQTSRLYE